MKARICSFLFAILMCFVAMLPVSAAQAVGGGVASGGTGGGTTFVTENQDSDSSNPYGKIPSSSEVLGMTGDPVTTDDVSQWVDRKGGDIITIATNIVQKISILGFIIALLLIVVGALGDKRTMIGGVIALAISCVTFTVATCCPQIIQFVSSWLKS